METSQKSELTQLALDIIALIKSIQGLVNLTKYVNSKEDEQEIYKRLEKCIAEVQLKYQVKRKNYLEGGVSYLGSHF